MARFSLDRQIHHLQDEILLLGSMVEQAVINAVEALRRRDIQSAQLIYAQDQQINDKRFAIENAILILIATQQPMAHDLRLLAAMLEVITELERMGDYAKGIAKVVNHIDGVELPVPNLDFSEMAKIATNMLRRSLYAFSTEDVNLAMTIPLEDDQVDALYNQVYHNMVRAMIARPEIIDHANQLMWVAHNLERMADRVTNICERVVFISTGELLEIESSDDE